MDVKETLLRPAVAGAFISDGDQNRLYEDFACLRIL
jgi:hypothetical protein